MENMYIQALSDVTIMSGKLSEQNTKWNNIWMFNFGSNM